MDIFVARQPIFDIDNKVVAYELLFRNSYDNRYTGKNGDSATLNVINSLYTLGIDNVTNGKYAFINFTENLLNQHFIALLPPDIVAIEVLESVYPNDNVIMECKKIKKQGFSIVLDDFVFDEKYRELIQFADIIKIDFTITKGSERKKVIEKVNSNTIKFLAEKVETIEEFNEAKSLGYSYFQGYYFSKPIILSGKDIPQDKLINFRILKELSNKDLDIDGLEKLILIDVSLSFKLLKLINSTAFSLKNKVSSIKQAISLLGEKEIKKWMCIVLIHSLGENNTTELINYTLIRAKFAELLALKMGLNRKSYDSYITGLLSFIDVILGQPIDIIVNDLCLSNEVKDALLDKENILNSIIKLITFYEKGLWDKVDLYSKKLKIDKSDLSNCYFESLNWLKQLNGYRFSL
ncbi:HDOD domain-containing protein [Clostridium sp. P21]|uniref:HDOD domain-containing protein n=1 Tax=Clostridium muellerianum TaxID=2716538 RepID=A0A7Y0EEI9_9CLOT|nr:HDOD domain-containing protein [Clostridium muellerianum]NMM62015.1 HDOD domain-containing protein [Clostridium muellerianum]